MINNKLLPKTFKYDSLSSLSSNQDITSFDIAFHADHEAMGTPGLFLVLANNTLYIGDTLYCNNQCYENELITIEERMPQLIRILGNGDKVLKRRKYSYRNYQNYYLGMGNYCLIKKSYQKKNNLQDLNFTSLFEYLHKKLDKNFNIVEFAHQFNNPR